MSEVSGSAGWWQVFFYICPCFSSLLWTSPAPLPPATARLPGMAGLAFANMQPLSPPTPRAGMTNGLRRGTGTGAETAPRLPQALSSGLWLWHVAGKQTGFCSPRGSPVRLPIQSLGFPLLTSLESKLRTALGGGLARHRSQGWDFIDQMPSV